MTDIQKKYFLALLYDVAGLVQSQLAWLDADPEQHSLSAHAADEVEQRVKSHTDKLMKAGISRQESGAYFIVAAKVVDKITTAHIEQIDARIDELIQEVTPANDWTN